MKGDPEKYGYVQTFNLETGEKKLMTPEKFIEKADRVGGAYTVQGRYVDMKGCEHRITRDQKGWKLDDHQRPQGGEDIRKVLTKTAPISSVKTDAQIDRFYRSGY